MDYTHVKALRNGEYRTKVPKKKKTKPTRQTRQPLTLSIVLPILDTEPWRSLWAFPTLMFVAFALSIKSDIVALTASEAVSSCGSAMEWKNKS